jgi:hypothetical protein
MDRDNHISGYLGNKLWIRCEQNPWIQSEVLETVDTIHPRSQESGMEGRQGESFSSLTLYSSHFASSSPRVHFLT